MVGDEYTRKECGTFYVVTALQTHTCTCGHEHVRRVRLQNQETMRSHSLRLETLDQNYSAWARPRRKR